MKRVRDTIIWLSLVTGIVALLFMSIRRKTNAEVKTLVVHVTGIQDGQKLISDKEIEEKLSLTAGKKLTKANIKTLNLPKMEAILNKDKRIERADLYFDSKDRLNVRIVQKKPVVRVIEEAGTSYYLDEYGKTFPVTPGKVIRVPIVTGHVGPYDSKFLEENSKSKLKEVFQIMKYVYEDAFLSSLIEQVHVENDSIGDIVLVPKIGREKLIFGNAMSIKDKFDKLKIFYRDGLPRLGWSRYKSLNLKYTDQIAGQLMNPGSARFKMPTVSDSTQVALNVDNNKQESIHH